MYLLWAVLASACNGWMVLVVLKNTVFVRAGCVYQRVGFPFALTTASSLAGMEWTRDWHTGGVMDGSTYIHTYIHKDLQTDIPAYNHTYKHTFMDTYIHTHIMHAYIFTNIHAYKHTHTHIHTHIHAHIHTYIHRGGLCDVLCACDVCLTCDMWVMRLFLFCHLHDEFVLFVCVSEFFCLYVCLNICMIHTHAYIRAYTLTYIHANIHTVISFHTNIHTYTPYFGHTIYERGENNG